MTNLVVERAHLSQMMEEWLKALGVGESDRLEVVFLSQEVIIRPQSPRNAELDEWLEQAGKKYDKLLRRLADS